MANKLRTFFKHGVVKEAVATGAPADFGSFLSFHTSRFLRTWHAKLHCVEKDGHNFDCVQ